jgi:hypothetical protein
MAQVIVNNGNTGLAARTAINSNFTELYDSSFAKVVSVNTNAILDASYIVVGNVVFTDPTPEEGKGYEVFERNGSATIGGVVYQVPGTTIKRIFHSGSWQSYLTSSSSRTLLTKSLNQFMITGTTSEISLDSFQMLGGSFRTFDNIYFESFFQKLGTVGTVTLRLRVNTSNTLVGATQLATYTSFTAQTFFKFTRSIYIDSTLSTSNVIQSTASLINDNVAVNTFTSLGINWSQTQWFFLTAQLSSASDSAILENYYFDLTR